MRGLLPSKVQCRHIRLGHDPATSGLYPGTIRDPDRPCFNDHFECLSVKLILLFIIVGAMACWSHIGTGSTEEADKVIESV